MSQVLKLFKIQFDEKFDILKTGNKKKMIGSIIKYLLIIGVLMFTCYTLFLKFVLLGLKINASLISTILLVTQLISLFFVIGGTIKNLFQNKDNELLMSMPVSPNQVFVSKIILSYVQEVIITSVITIPLVFSVGFMGGAPAGFGLSFYLLMPLLIVVLPILPLSIALLISVPATYVLKFFKKHFILATIIILAVVVVAITVYVNVLSGIAEGFDIVSKQIEIVKGANKAITNIGTSNFIYLLLAKAIMFPSKLYGILVYLLISAAIFMAAFFAVKPFFFKIAMGNLEHSVTAQKNATYKTTTPFKSMLKVEFLNVFRSPGIIFDNFLFTLLMPFVVVVYDNLLLGMVVNQTGVQMINGAHILIVAVFATLSNLYSASAISREGTNFYLIKTSPINYYKQTLAKLLFNAIFSAGAIVLTGMVTALYMDGVVVLFTTLICLFISFGHMFYSFDKDLKHPSLDWFNSEDISKINKNTTTSIVSGLILALLAGIIIMALASTNLGVWAFVIVLVLSIIYCLYMAHILILRVFYQYERLEP